MAQYDAFLPVALEGQIVDTSLRNIDSRAASSIIEFGVPLTIDPNNPEVGVLPWTGAITTKFLGISVYSPLEMTGNYQVTRSVSVLTFGRIWVKKLIAPGAVIVANDPAYLEAVTGHLTNSPTNNLLIGKFISSGTGASSPENSDLIKLEIRI